MSGNRLLLDTNIFLGIVTGNASIVSWLMSLDSPEIFTSVICRIELLGYHAITLQEHEKLINVLAPVPIIPLSASIENRTIELRREMRIKTPDGIVGATAIEIDAVLVSSDSELCRKMSRFVETFTP